MEILKLPLIETRFRPAASERIFAIACRFQYYGP
jgi:hypothetical protein